MSFSFFLFIDAYKKYRTLKDSLAKDKKEECKQVNKNSACQRFARQDENY